MLVLPSNFLLLKRLRIKLGAAAMGILFSHLGNFSSVYSQLLLELVCELNSSLMVRTFMEAKVRNHRLCDGVSRRAKVRIRPSLLLVCWGVSKKIRMCDSCTRNRDMIRALLSTSLIPYSTPSIICEGAYMIELHSTRT
jgi:hypothetical protein